MGAMCLDWYSRKPQQGDKRTGGSSVLRQGMGVKPKPITKGGDGAFRHQAVEQTRGAGGFGEGGAYSA
jgi:hypothetical protein